MDPLHLSLSSHSSTFLCEYPYLNFFYFSRHNFPVFVFCSRNAFFCILTVKTCETKRFRVWCSSDQTHQVCCFRKLGFHFTQKKIKNCYFGNQSIVSCYFVCLWFLGDIIYALKVVVGKSDDCISDRSYGFYR
jgi:hypothetical protein